MTRRSRFQRRRAVVGAVYVEFLMTFVPFVVFFLGMTQIFLSFQARLLVKHSADAAVRSAIVVVTDGADIYGSSPPNTMDTGGTGEASLEELLSAIIEQAQASIETGSNQFDVSEIFDRLTNLGDSRMNFVRLAAAKPLLPLGRAPETNDVHGAIGGDGAISNLGASIGDLLSRTALTFPAGDDGTPQSQVQITAPGQDLTARVTYLFRCTVPIAANLMCQTFAQLTQSDPALATELSHSIVPRTQSGPGGRFLALQAQSTLTAQYADYVGLQ